MKNYNLVWFRRDLRLDDNTALKAALEGKFPVLCLFIFDKNILEKLPDSKDRRVAFIHHRILDLNNKLKTHGSGLVVKYGKPIEIFSEILNTHIINAVFTNGDYEPYATLRDSKIEALLNSKGILFNKFKDQVIFEKREVVKDNGEPYTIFTPYMRKWKEKLNHVNIKYEPNANWSNLAKVNTSVIPTLEEIGFKNAECEVLKPRIDEKAIDNYHKTRDYPATKGTSGISVHLRFGTVSIRNLLEIASKKNETWLNELIWREFYMMILWNFPHVVEHSFKKDYDRIQWRNNEVEFERWCEGRTGYPMVDAGMRELNTTGFMHNRLRMITASFLVKHLLVDWRWGEQYFADKLIDFELSSNNGGWQWAASSGCDAVPYFRIFNPELQSKKFDPQEIYIKKWVPEYGTNQYVEPIVEHKFARERALNTYKSALS